MEIDIHQIRCIDSVRRALTREIQNNQLIGDDDFSPYDYFLFPFEELSIANRNVIVAEFPNHSYIQNFYSTHVRMSINIWNMDGRINDGSERNNRFIASLRSDWNKLNENSKIIIRNVYVDDPFMNLIDIN